MWEGEGREYMAISGEGTGGGDGTGWGGYVVKISPINGEMMG